MTEDESTNPYQRSAQWFNDRCGCLTASRAAEVFAVSSYDGKPRKAYYDLIDKILLERITNECESNFTTKAMQWGIDHEGDAREEYEYNTGETVELVGFVHHPEIPWFGASPDGLVGDEGLIEIKCPTTLVHLRRIKAGVVPEEYKPQMLVQCLCTGRKWVDFVDYDPRLYGTELEPLAYWKIRYTPTKAELEDALNRCKAFLQEVHDSYKELIDLVNKEEEIEF